MPNNITDVDTFTSPALSPADGEAASAAAFLPVAQALANRTRNLYRLLTEGPIVVLPTTGTDVNAITATGRGLGHGLTGTGGASGGIGVRGTGTVGNPGVRGVGNAAAPGVLGIGGGSSGAPGVTGTGGSVNGIGVIGNGVDAGTGVKGLSGTGVGVHGIGGTNNIGVKGEGTGTGDGVKGVGATGVGVRGVGGTDNTGVVGEGTGNAHGVSGTAGASGGYGVFGSSANASLPAIGGVSTGTNGIGVSGVANTGTTAKGVSGTSSSGIGVNGLSTATGTNCYGGFFQAAPVSGNGGTAIYASALGASGGFGAANCISLDGNSELAPLRMNPTPSGLTGGVPSGASLVGDMFVTAAGVLKICISAGTGVGAVWTSVGAQL